MMKDELTERELYQELWQGRDFEINHLWQRSIFLGAFMVAIAAGYGGLVNEHFKEIAYYIFVLLG